jgi:hypothetical protein
VDESLKADAAAAADRIEQTLGDHAVVLRVELPEVAEPIAGAAWLLREAVAGRQLQPEDAPGGYVRPREDSTATALEAELEELRQQLGSLCDRYREVTGSDPRRTQTDGVGARLGAAEDALDTAMVRLRAGASR